MSADPIAQFGTWLEDARKSEPNDPEAVALATADADGQPNVRMVLMKLADARGFAFYTNRESAKGQELSANPFASMCFHWKSLRRQVRVRGSVSIMEDWESDAYFASRPRDSQIGAWASRQSRAIDAPFALEREIAMQAMKFGFGPVPRPPYWGGYRLSPLRIEFWTDRPFRLHERVVHWRDELNLPWQTEKLFP